MQIANISHIAHRIDTDISHIDTDVLHILHVDMDILHINADVESGWGFQHHPDDSPDDYHPRPASLSDAWEVTRPPYSPTPASSTSMPSLSQAIETFGVIADSPLNSYSAGKHLVAHAIAWQGKRLDYILFRDPTPIPSCPITLTPTLQIKYLDHARSTTSNNELRMAQNQPMANISALSVPAPVQKTARLTAADASAVLGDLTSCYRYSLTRAKRHLSLFGLSVGTLLSLQPPLVGSQPGQHHLSY
ncbi:hypothetical protein BGY98DRAFT_1186604 [Russula aff. rugulosa BPL654]|nr:hypothetical protein BGY98DRAFT_1186604 [Russula aff. rugulosa BPL654]